MGRISDLRSWARKNRTEIEAVFILASICAGAVGGGFIGWSSHGAGGALAGVLFGMAAGFFLGVAPLKTLGVVGLIIGILVVKTLVDVLWDVR